MHEHICACLSKTFFDGPDFGEEKLREALPRHAHCWKEDEVDLSLAAAGVKKLLALWTEVTALDKVKAAQRSLEKYFTLNASIERVFRHCRGRYKNGPAHIVTVKLVAGLHPPEFKTKVVTALDMKGSWKKHPDLVFSVFAAIHAKSGVSLCNC